MLRKVRLPEPKNRQARHTVFPEKIGQCFHYPGVLLQMARWKRTERGGNRSKRVARQRFAREQRDAARSPHLHPLPFGEGRGGLARLAKSACNVSIQQEPDSFCRRNYRAPACALDEFGNGWNGDVFSTREFISLLHYR